MDISIDNRGYINLGVKEIECADGELTKIVINNYGVVDFTNGEGNFSGYHADLLFNKIGSELIGDAAVFSQEIIRSQNLELKARKNQFM